MNKSQSLKKYAREHLTLTEQQVYWEKLRLIKWKVINCQTSIMSQSFIGPTYMYLRLNTGVTANQLWPSTELIFPVFYKFSPLISCKISLLITVSGKLRVFLKICICLITRFLCMTVVYVRMVLVFTAPKHDLPNCKRGVRDGMHGLKRNYYN